VSFGSRSVSPRRYSLGVQRDRMVVRSLGRGRRWRAERLVCDRTVEFCWLFALLSSDWEGWASVVGGGLLWRGIAVWWRRIGLVGFVQFWALEHVLWCTGVRPAEPPEIGGSGFCPEMAEKSVIWCGESGLGRGVEAWPARVFGADDRPAIALSRFAALAAFLHAEGQVRLEGDPGMAEGVSRRAGRGGSGRCPAGRLRRCAGSGGPRGRRGAWLSHSGGCAALQVVLVDAAGRRLLVARCWCEWVICTSRRTFSRFSAL